MSAPTQADMDAYKEHQEALKAMGAPDKDWQLVEIKVADQDQVIDLLNGLSTNTTGGVDVWVRTNEDRPRTWRVGTANMPSGPGFHQANVGLNRYGFDVGDTLKFYFEDKGQATLFKLANG